MRYCNVINRAPNWAPCLVLGFAFFTLVSPVLGAGCSSDYYDEVVTVKYVHDGDTLRLQDGRKLRLVGVNTPELARENRQVEPFAAAAKVLVQSLIVSKVPGVKATRIKLRYGKEKHDRHGRLLAHVFTVKGQNITQALLESGLGSAIQIAPNLWAHECYLAAEKKAQTRKQGIWGDPYFLPVMADDLKTSARGYRFVQGKISRIGQSKNALWLNLGEKFVIRIRKADWQYFDIRQLKNAKGKSLTVRGWLYKYKDRLQVNISHPAAISWH